MQYSYARRTLEALWQGLCKLADSDHDELISLDEWVELLKKVDLKNRTEPRWFNDYQTFMFKLFDVSGNYFLKFWISSEYDSNFTNWVELI